MKLDLDVFVISLVRATERRLHVEKEFSKIGMEFNYFDGVDGTAEQANLLNKTDQTAWRRFMGAEITPGHLGCYASHVELWRKIGENGKLALVCEDDVTFLPEFPDALQNALELQNEWDICRFSKIRAKGPICIAQKNGFKLNQYWGPFTGNACYLIKPELASRLASEFYPIRRAHDHELNRFFHYDFRLTGLEPFSAPPVDRGQSYITGVDMGNTGKLPRVKRFAHYRHKIANYFRRLEWLVRKVILKR